MIELIKYNKSAFTLIEITIALLILAIGLVGILALFPVGFDAMGRANNVTVATFLAQGEMEDIKREGYDGTRITAAIDEWPDAVSGDFLPDYSTYEFEVFAQDGIPDPSNDRMLTESICEVTVFVYWPADAESRDNQRSVELKTYIAKYEP